MYKIFGIRFNNNLTAKIGSMDRYNSKIKSPRREAINKQLDQHTNRIRDLMQQDYVILEQENIQLKIKCAKVNELQDKVELVLRNNQELMFENEKLARLVEMNMQEFEMLSRKLEATKRNEGLTQYQRKKLMLQIERLEKQIAQMEHLKVITIKEIKSKHITEIQELRKDHEVGLGLYDGQLVKLKQEIDRKAAQVTELQNQLKKSEAETEQKSHQHQEEKLKLKQEIKRLEPYPRLFQKLKEDYDKLVGDRKQQTEIHLNKLKQSSQKHKADIEHLKNQARAQMQSAAHKMRELTQKHKRQIENLKNELQDQNEEYANKLREATNKQKEEIDMLDEQAKKKILQMTEENSSVREKLRREQQKSQELQQKILQLLKDKQEQEKVQEKLHLQIESQKRQIQQLTLLNMKQYEALQEKYQSLRQAELFEIQASHEQHRKFCMLDREKQNQIIRSLEKELVYLSTENEKLNLIFHDEGNQLKSQLFSLHNEYRKREQDYALEIQKIQAEWMERLKKCQIQIGLKMRKLEDDSNLKVKKVESDYAALKLRLESQITNLERQRRKLVEENNKKSTEVVAYKQIVENQKEQIKQINKKVEQKQKIFKKTQQEWLNTNAVLQSKIQRIEEAFESFRQQTKKKSEEIQRRYRQNLNEKQRMIERLERQNETIKQFVGNRDRNILEVNKRISELNQAIEDKNQIIDKLRSQIVELTQKNISRIQGEKASIHQHYTSKIKFMSEDYNSKILLLEARIEDLTEQAKVKQNQLDELLRQYKKMREEMVVLSEQDANRREMSLKFPGATADLIATKNMFDVMIKAKVLQTCHEVVRKSIQEGEQEL